MIAGVWQNFSLQNRNPILQRVSLYSSSFHSTVHSPAVTHWQVLLIFTVRQILYKDIKLTSLYKICLTVRNVTSGSWTKRSLFSPVDTETLWRRGLDSTTLQRVRERILLVYAHKKIMERIPASRTSKLCYGRSATNQQSTAC